MPHQDGYTAVPFRGGLLSVSSLPLPSLAGMAPQTADTYGDFTMPGLDNMEGCEDDMGLMVGVRGPASQSEPGAAAWSGRPRVSCWLADVCS